ncbi:MAG: glycosyltransferase family 2 protein [Chloroflexota bacterium]
MERLLMPELPLVSVIVPCWNAGSVIARTLASVLDERTVSLECIVVDDASTDETLEVVQELARADPRIVLLRQPANEGVSSARNRALDVARGEWLTLLDADDRFFPGGIAALDAAARGTDALAVVGQQVWSDGQGHWVSSLYEIPDIREPGRKSLATHPGLLYFVSPHAKLFHRSIVDGLRFEGRVLGDQPWVIRALLRAGNRIEVIGTTVYEWIRAAPGATAPPSITTTTRSSAARGVEAASIASAALATVMDEAGQLLAEADARRVAATYVERLLRSDLGVHLSRALARRDPTMAELLAALEAFVSAAPADLLRASDALAREIVEPPLRRWSRVPASAREPYWSLVGAAVAADPELPSRGTTPMSRLRLRLAAEATPASRRAAVALSRPGRLLARARRMVSRHRSAGAKRPD